MSEPCLCAAPDCPICGPMQGYRQARRYPLGSLSAEDIDILNEEESPMSELLSPEGYAATGGVVCPVCGATEVEMEMDFSASDFRTVIQAADCLACHAAWEAVYELTGYQALERQESN